MTKEEWFEEFKKAEGDIDSISEEAFDKLEIISEGEWIDNGKYDYLDQSVFRDTETGVHYMVGLYRSGSYYSDYDYQFTDLHPVEQVEITKTVWKVIK